MSCFNCSLAYTRNNMVSGNGNTSKNLMFLGEAPGHTEDKLGVPFVGKAGKYLTGYLEKIGFIRNEHYYITNVIKCRPPMNRPPTDYEIKQCKPNLIKEIGLVNPKILVTLGSTATKLFLGDVKITKVNAQSFTIGNSLIIPVYHPSYVLRNNEVKIDFLKGLLLVKHYYISMIDPFFK